MIENLATSAVATPVANADPASKDPQGGSAPAPVDTASPSSTTTPDASDPSKPTTRLFIDQDKTTGVFVYRVVDAATGNLLVEIPSEQVANLKDADDYAAGALISTSA